MKTHRVFVLILMFCVSACYSNKTDLNIEVEKAKYVKVSILNNGGTLRIPHSFIDDTRGPEETLFLEVLSSEGKAIPKCVTVMISGSDLGQKVLNNGDRHSFSIPIALIKQRYCIKEAYLTLIRGSINKQDLISETGRSNTIKI